MSGEREEARASRKARRQDERRRRILGAARALLEEQGPAGLTMTALARAADTSAPTLYYYFSSKEAVVDGLAVQLLEEETEMLRQALESASGGVDSVEAVMQARARFYVERPGAFRVLYGAMVSLGVSAETLQQHVYPLSARTMGELERRLFADQERGTVHGELRPREFANVAFFAVQGILGAALGIAEAGGDLRFGVEALLAEAVATMRRGARP
jgi:AcrR family transcriptional regulator